LPATLDGDEDDALHEHGSASLVFIGDGVKAGKGALK